MYEMLLMCVCVCVCELTVPDVWRAIQIWYGGGPAIERSVIVNERGALELEMYPLYLRVAMCDMHGQPQSFAREVSECVSE